MADIVLFHHALGLTPGCHSLADRLRAGGHSVHDEFFAGEGDLDHARELVAQAAATTRAELFTYPGTAHLFVDDSTDGHDAGATALVVEHVLDLLRHVDEAASRARSGRTGRGGA